LGQVDRGSRHQYSAGQCRARGNAGGYARRSLSCEESFLAERAVSAEPCRASLWRWYFCRCSRLVAQRRRVGETGSRSRPGGRAESTSASVDNMNLIASESSDIAFTLADTAADAVEGREDFEGDPVPAQALAQLYLNYTQIATTAGSGIDSVEDLRDRSVSVGSPSSGTEVIALRVLRAAGIDPDSDIDRQQLGVDESVDA